MIEQPIYTHIEGGLENAEIYGNTRDYPLRKILSPWIGEEREHRSPAMLVHEITVEDCIIEVTI